MNVCVCVCVCVCARAHTYRLIWDVICLNPFVEKDL
jgi:hypothetical protein